MSGLSELSELVDVVEFVPKRLYLGVLKQSAWPRSLPSSIRVHSFCVDQDLVYENFYDDYGPLNLSQLFRYCDLLNKKLRSDSLSKKMVLHYAHSNYANMANAAYLMASYAIMYLHMTPESALHILSGLECRPDLSHFTDASCYVPGSQQPTISMGDCLRAVHKARKANFFDFDDFDFEEYEHYEKVRHGDFNWLVPDKFLAFCGPHSTTIEEFGYPQHAPEYYFPYFKLHNVSTIVRLNKRIYDAQRFVRAGFEHKDLFFTDGTTPSDTILQQFLDICEHAPGAIAVHCKAGLGRTGSLIGCYIMKHWKWDALTTIAWLRICRPGSVIGQQQDWLIKKQSEMWRQGVQFRKDPSHQANPGVRKVCAYPVYSLIQKGILSPRMDSHLAKMVSKVQKITIEDEANGNLVQTRPNEPTDAVHEDLINDNSLNRLPAVDTDQAQDDHRSEASNGNEVQDILTQGDKLNQLKAQKQQTTCSPATRLLQSPVKVASSRSRSTGSKSVLPSRSSPRNSSAVR